MNHCTRIFSDKSLNIPDISGASIVIQGKNIDDKYDALLQILKEMHEIHSKRNMDRKKSHG